MLQSIPDEERIVVLTDGTEVYIKNPTRQIREESDNEGTKAFYRAIDSGCKMRNQMISWLKEKGLWHSESEDVARLQQELYILRERIDGGGIKKSEAKNYAIRCIQIEAAINNYLAQEVAFLSETVEAKKRNAEFNYLVYACSVYNNDRRKQFYSTYDDYLNAQETLDNDNIVKKCTELFYGVPDLNTTPERAFLKQQGFVNDKMQLINEDGHLVDFDGRLIDEEGNYIKYVGTGTKKKVVLVDIDGNEIQPFERKPFLDDDGQPIGVETKEQPKKTRKKIKTEEKKTEEQVE